MWVLCGVMWSYVHRRFLQTGQACYGLADTPVLVGGADPDYSWVRLTDDVCQSGQPQPGKSKLPDHGLAQVTFSCGVKNLTSRGPCWDVQMIPRRHRQSNATSHFDHMGQLLEAAVLANGGKGPVVLAYDAHMNHSFVTTFAMGLSSDSSVSSSASSFWRRCRFESMSYLPAWPYRQLRYNHEDVMFVTLDAGHVQKAIARAGRSSIRKVEIGAFWVPWSNICRTWSNAAGWRRGRFSAFRLQVRDGQAFQEALQ